MRVALDAAPLRLPAGGLRRYVAELSRALACAFPEDEFVLACDHEFRLPEPAPPNLYGAPAPRTAVERRWWSLGLNRVLARERAAVFHGTNFEVPYRPARPAILTLHDLSPWHDRFSSACSARVRRRTPPLIRLGIATAIITPTEAVRREAIDHFRLAPDRVFAIPEAASSVFHRIPAVSGARPYFLYVGDSGPRKNLEMLVELWRNVPELRDVELVRVCAEADDITLARLYSGARALLCPSFYEGFGLPVVEAMQCGAPVIAARIPALAEVAGDAAILLDPRDARTWVDAIIRMSEREDLRSAYSERSLGRASAFSWERTARLTREVYVEAIRRFHA